MEQYQCNCKGCHWSQKRSCQQRHRQILRRNQGLLGQFAKYRHRWWYCQRCCGDRRGCKRNSFRHLPSYWIDRFGQRDFRACQRQHKLGRWQGWRRHVCHHGQPPSKSYRRRSRSSRELCRASAGRNWKFRQCRSRAPGKCLGPYGRWFWQFFYRSCSDYRCNFRRYCYRQYTGGPPGGYSGDRREHLWGQWPCGIWQLYRETPGSRRIHFRPVWRRRRRKRPGPPAGKHPPDVWTRSRGRFWRTDRDFTICYGGGRADRFLLDRDGKAHHPGQFQFYYWNCYAHSTANLHRRRPVYRHYHRRFGNRDYGRYADDWNGDTSGYAYRSRADNRFLEGWKRGHSGPAGRSKRIRHWYREYHGLHPRNLQWSHYLHYRGILRQLAAGVAGGKGHLRQRL